MSSFNLPKQLMGNFNERYIIDEFFFNHERGTFMNENANEAFQSHFFAEL